MASSVTPSARSMERLRGQGFIVEKVERWNHFAGIRQDLFGVFDIVAVHPERKVIVGVQVTTDKNLAARRTKMLESQKARAWCHAGGRAVIHAWGKEGKGRGRRWRVKVEDVTEQLSCRIYDSGGIGFGEAIGDDAEDAVAASATA